MTTAEIITTIGSAAGGSAIVVAGFAAWLGKVWSGRIIEAEKASHARELELLRSQLQLAQANEQRQAETKFDLYIEVWNHLQDLKSVADDLWARASRETLAKFLVEFNNARVAANRGRLILDENDYQALQRVFQVFSDFQLGKKRLVDIHTGDEFAENYQVDSEDRIQSQIEHNRQFKEEYERLLDKIVVQFRDRLRIV